MSKNSASGPVAVLKRRIEVLCGFIIGAKTRRSNNIYLCEEFSEEKTANLRGQGQDLRKSDV
jgi:hypothetical protein